MVQILGNVKPKAASQNLPRLQKKRPGPSNLTQITKEVARPVKPYPDYKREGQARQSLFCLKWPMAVASRPARLFNDEGPASSEPLPQSPSQTHEHQRRLPSSSRQLFGSCSTASAQGEGKSTRRHHIWWVPTPRSNLMLLNGAN